MIRNTTGCSSGAVSLKKNTVTPPVMRLVTRREDHETPYARIWRRRSRGELRFEGNVVEKRERRRRGDRGEGERW
jgi:hypothetical protein